MFANVRELNAQIDVKKDEVLKYATEVVVCPFLPNTKKNTVEANNERYRKKEEEVDYSEEETEIPTSQIQRKGMDISFFT